MENHKYTQAINSIKSALRQQRMGITIDSDFGVISDTAIRSRTVISAKIKEERVVGKRKMKISLIALRNLLSLSAEEKLIDAVYNTYSRCSICVWGIRDSPKWTKSPIEKKRMPIAKHKHKDQAIMSEPPQRKRYPSDLADAQWELIKAFVPPVSPNTAMATIERREIVNAILYMFHTGCSWKQMLHDLPNGKAAHHYLRF